MSAGRAVEWEPVDRGPLVTLVCDDGTFPGLHRWSDLDVAAGQPCVACGATLRLAGPVDRAVWAHLEARP